MTNTGDNAVPSDDQALEELLGQATPRPLPSAEAMQQAKAAVQSEWQQVTTQRTTRRRLTMFATAATVVLAVTLVMNTWLAPVVPSVQVATLEKSVGVIYLLGDESVLRRADNLEIVKTGQTIVTADDATVGLSWGQGGSLRLAEKTEVMFASAKSIELRSGRVYFDSPFNAETAADPALTITTEYGDVTHIGTQFITAIGNDSLTVSVREGRVAIDGRFHDGIAGRDEQLTFIGSQKPGRRSIKGYGPEWEWIETTAPITAMTRGKTLREFLNWVSRETGLDYRFVRDDLELLADVEELKGDISDSPRVALGQSLPTFGLDHDIEDGVIIIR